MDSKDFESLTTFIAEGDFDKCEHVPAGDEDGFLANPLGGLAVDMAGPAGYVCAQEHDGISPCPFEQNDTTGSSSPLCVVRRRTQI